MRAYHNIALEHTRCLRAREGVFDAVFRSMSPARASAVSLKIEKLEKNQAQSRTRKPFSGDSRYNGIWTNPIELQVVAYTRLKRAQQTRLAPSYEEFQFSLCIHVSFSYLSAGYAREGRWIYSRRSEGLLNRAVNSLAFHSLAKEFRVIRRRHGGRKTNSKLLEPGRIEGLTGAPRRRGKGWLEVWSVYKRTLSYW